MSDTIPVPLTRVEADARIPLKRWGEAVLRARKNRWMSQAELADQVGMKQQTISKIECGAVVPSDRTKVRIAHAIGMHPGHLFSWWDATDQSPPAGARARDRSEPTADGAAHEPEVG